VDKTPLDKLGWKYYDGMLTKTGSPDFARAGQEGNLVAWSKYYAAGESAWKKLEGKVLVWDELSDQGKLGDDLYKKYSLNKEEADASATTLNSAYEKCEKTCGMGFSQSGSTGRRLKGEMSPSMMYDDCMRATGGDEKMCVMQVQEACAMSFDGMPFSYDACKAFLSPSTDLGAPTKPHNDGEVRHEIDQQRENQILSQHLGSNPSASRGSQNVRPSGKETCVQGMRGCEMGQQIPARSPLERVGEDSYFAVREKFVKEGRPQGSTNLDDLQPVESYYETNANMGALGKLFPDIGKYKSMGNTWVKKHVMSNTFVQDFINDRGSFAAGWNA